MYKEAGNLCNRIVFDRKKLLFLILQTVSARCLVSQKKYPVTINHHSAADGVSHWPHTRYKSKSS